MPIEIQGPPPITLVMRKVKAEIGHCYMNCFQFMIRNFNNPYHEFIMVQGIVSGRKELEGRRIGHCWIEVEVDNEWLVYEPAFDAVVPRAFYYDRANPVSMHRYPLEQTLKMAVKLGWVGPWTDDVAAADHTEGEE